MSQYKYSMLATLFADPDKTKKISSTGTITDILARSQDISSDWLKKEAEKRSAQIEKEVEKATKKSGK